MSPDLKNQIEHEIKNNKIVIYMKGTANAPMCGFSARSVEILQSYNIPIRDFNILSSEELRQGIKEFTNWPTIPQIFINGEFVGGCDIITEMHENGELATMLKA
jgi:monothiol glutaredoxin